MKIEVLTVNYNTPELVKQLFLTISKHCSYELNYTVINNGPIKFVDASSIINVLDFINEAKRYIDECKRNTKLHLRPSKSSMFFAGIIDDTIGNRDVSGLKGHFKSLFKGTLTTGGFKALFGGFVGLIISVSISKDIIDIVVNTLVIALSTNLMNLFDLRPGRAIKVYLVIMITIFFTLSGYIQILTLLILPNVLAYFNFDLKAKAMMGDTGSNVLGISIGILMVLGYTLKVRIVWLVFLVLIHLLTEKFSLTKIIEKNKVLNFIDRLGR